MFNNLKKIWILLSTHQRRALIVLFAAVLFNSILEFFGIGLIMPIVTLIGNPDSIYNYPRLARVISFLGISDARHALKLAVIVFLVMFVFKGLYFIKLTHYQLKFTTSMWHDIASRLLRNYMFSPWTFHLEGNTAELLNNTINQSSNLCTGFISSIFIICTESCIVISIITLLLIVNPVATVVALTFLAGSSFILLYISKKKIVQLGRAHQVLNTKLLKSVNEALGGVKETKVLGREEYFVKTFIGNSKKYTKSQIYTTLIATIQRSVIETLFVCGIGVMALIILIQGHKASYFLPMLALFGVAAFRLMPSIHRINAAVASVRFNQPSLNVTHRDIVHIKTENDMLCKKDNKSDVLKFENRIDLEDMSFKYPCSDKDVLSSINMTIYKGKSVGFIGKSGAGKTTAVDIILGLLKPNGGGVFVDGVDIRAHLSAWRRHIGYIPQVIYLSDNTIMKNIAFGLEDEDIEEGKVWDALRSAQLYEFVKQLPEGLNTFVGERGVRISGGQRQRIGIARALYHNPNVLVMDEATSSLDHETEREIANSIFKLSGEKTLIIIAHRYTTVEKCDFIYEFKDGKAYMKSAKNMTKEQMLSGNGDVAMPELI